MCACSVFTWLRMRLSVTVMNTLLILLIPSKTGDFFPSGATVSVSRGFVVRREVTRIRSALLAVYRFVRFVRSAYYPEIDYYLPLSVQCPCMSHTPVCTCMVFVDICSVFHM